MEKIGPVLHRMALDVNNPRIIDSKKKDCVTAAPHLHPMKEGGAAAESTLKVAPHFGRPNELRRLAVDAVQRKLTRQPIVKAEDAALSIHSCCQAN